jgi:Glutathione S-transferase
MSLTVYGHPVSQPTRSVLMYLTLLGKDFDFKEVNVLKMEHKTPEFLKINPIGLIPAITDGDYSLAECSAILTYLAKSFKDTKFYPENPKIAGKIHMYQSWHVGNTRPGLVAAFVAWAKAIFPPELVVFTLEEALKRAEAMCEKFQNIFLADTKYIAGDQLTIADLQALPEFQNVAICCEFDFKGKFPKIAEWMERVQAEPALKDSGLPVVQFKEFVLKAQANKEKEEKTQ